MTVRFSHRLPATAILALCAAVLLLLAMSARTMAQAHKAACKPSSAHHRHGARPCAASKGASKSGGKGHKAHHKTRGHSKGAPPRHSTGAQGAACEDGSAPPRAGGGSFACADGSEPACADGLTPAASDGTALVCPGGGEAPETSAASCEADGGSASGSADAATCEDSAEP
jgi:hypothetical protein